MRKLLLTIVIAVTSYLILPTVSTATNRNVIQGGGGFSTTISACLAAMATPSGGDTCTVFAGTYNEILNIPAGSIGNYNVLTVNGSDIVSILSVTVNSHTKVIGNCTPPAVAGSCGFTIQNISNPFVANSPCVKISLSSTDAVIANNTMAQCGGNGATTSFAMIGGSRNGTIGGASFIYIQNNTLTHGCSLLGVNDVCESISLDWDHFLIEGNDLAHNNDSIELYASFVVARNNSFHDIIETECNSAQHGSNCHPDIFETEPNFAGGTTHQSQHELFEGNNVKHSVCCSNNHIYLFQGDACGSTGNCIHAINRLNLFYD